MPSHFPLARKASAACTPAFPLSEERLVPRPDLPRNGLVINHDFRGTAIGGDVRRQLKCGQAFPPDAVILVLDGFLQSLVGVTVVRISEQAYRCCLAAKFNHGLG